MSTNSSVSVPTPSSAEPAQQVKGPFKALRSVTMALSAQGYTDDADAIRKNGLEGAGISLKELQAARADLREMEEAVLREAYPRTYWLRQSVDVPVWLAFAVITMVVPAILGCIVALFTR